MNEHGLEDRNHKRHNKSWVINLDTESCVGHAQGRIGETKNTDLTLLKEQNGACDTQTRSHKKEVVWKGTCEHYLS